MSENKTLIIWMKDGSTLKFEQVDFFRELEADKSIKFDYFGVSTQVVRSATFKTNNIAGYALA